MPPRPQPTSRRDTAASQPQTLADRRAHAGQSYHIPGLRGSRAPLPATAIRLAREVTAGFGYLYVPREPVCSASRTRSSRRSRRAWSAAEMAPSVMASSATTVAPFQGLKSTAGMPVARRSGNSSFGNVSNGGRIRCMQIWPIEGIKKFETLSYLPPLTAEDLLKQIEYLLRSKWVPCLEFSKVGFVYRENNRSPGYYDGRYWTMWKLPMFGCSDATQVLKEVEEANKAYPDAFVRIIGFDNVRQVQCISFIAYKPPGCEESGGN